MTPLLKDKLQRIGTFSAPVMRLLTTFSIMKRQHYVSGMNLLPFRMHIRAGSLLK
jgi:hypothetical protein